MLQDTSDLIEVNMTLDIEELKDLLHEATEEIEPRAAPSGIYTDGKPESMCY
jgi:hypothetical protein